VAGRIGLQSWGGHWEHKKPFLTQCGRRGRSQKKGGGKEGEKSSQPLTVFLEIPSPKKGKGIIKTTPYTEGDRRKKKVKKGARRNTNLTGRSNLTFEDKLALRKKTCNATGVSGARRGEGGN